MPGDNVSDEFKVYLPNSFTPNWDGDNDVFKIFSGASVSKINAFRIFNRWGGVAFEVTDSPVNDTVYGWDGKTNGEVAQSGVYVWKAEVRFVDGVVKLLSGSVTVVY